MEAIFDIRSDGLLHGFQNQLNSEQLSSLRCPSRERTLLVSGHIKGERLREVYAAVEDVLGIEPGGLVYPYICIPNDERMPMLHRNAITLSLTGLSQDEICTRLGMDRHTASRIFSHVPYLRYMESKRMGAMAGLLEADLGMKELIGESISVMRDLLKNGKEETRAKLAMAIVKGMPQLGVSNTGVSAESGVTLKAAASDAVFTESEARALTESEYEPGKMIRIPSGLLCPPPDMATPEPVRYPYLERNLVDEKYPLLDETGMRLYT